MRDSLGCNSAKNKDFILSSARVTLPEELSVSIGALAVTGGKHQVGTGRSAPCLEAATSVAA
jgi:hypothetical protein